jgi:hypothetical protein
MRRLSYSLLLVLAAGYLPSSCKKHNTPAPIPDNLSLIKHKWQVVSLNGEALRYVGQPADYYNFGNDTLIRSLGGQVDTLAYKLINNGLTLDIYPFKVTTIPTGAQTLSIQTLTDSRLILTSSSFPIPVSVLDSLSR